MNAVTQEQARNMRAALAESVRTMHVGKKQTTVSLVMSNGTYNLIDYLLGRIESGELTEAPAVVRSYVQPGLLAEQDGAPLSTQSGLMDDLNAMAALFGQTEQDGDDDDGGYCGPTCGRFGNW